MEEYKLVFLMNARALRNLFCDRQARTLFSKLALYLQSVSPRIFLYMYYTIHVPSEQCAFLKSSSIPDPLHTHSFILISGSNTTQTAPRAEQFLLQGALLRDGMILTEPGPTCFQGEGTRPAGAA